MRGRSSRDASDPASPRRELGAPRDETHGVTTPRAVPRALRAGWSVWIERRVRRSADDRLLRENGGQLDGGGGHPSPCRATRRPATCHRRCDGRLCARHSHGHARAPPRLACAFTTAPRSAALSRTRPQDRGGSEPIRSRIRPRINHRLKNPPTGPPFPLLEARDRHPRTVVIDDRPKSGSTRRVSIATTRARDRREQHGGGVVFRSEKGEK